MLKSIFAMATLALGVCLVPGTVQAQVQDSVWNRIYSRGEIICGGISAYKPTSFKADDVTGYEGYGPNICRAIARDLSAEMKKYIAVRWQETSFQTAVLDLQSGRIDLFPGLSATEERMKAIDMEGPLYHLSDCITHGKNAPKHKTWEEYNNPESKFALIAGSAQEQFIAKSLPKAQVITLKQDAEVILAVQSGRANMIVQGLAVCLQTFATAPAAFREISIPEPERSVPSSAGTRKDSDGRFKNWLQAWAEKAIASGGINWLMLDGFEKSGMNVKALPDSLKF